MKVLLIISSFLTLSIFPEGELTTSGGDVWTSQNLSVSTFRNGDTIFHAKSKEEWETAFNNETPAFCYYKNDSTYGKIIGKLYNYYAVMDERGLAPEGWHVATDKEWGSLIVEYGGNVNAGKKLSENDF